MGGLFIEVFWYVIMLVYHVFELVLNKIGNMVQYIWDGIVFEYVIWIELLNGGCVCYSNKHNAFDRGWLWYQIRFGVWVSALEWSQIRVGIWVNAREWSQIRWGMVCASALISYTVYCNTDVTRLVVTERVQHKYSLFDSFALYCSNIILIYWQGPFDRILAQ